MDNPEILKEFDSIESGSKFISKNFSLLQKKFGNKFVVIKENDILVNAESFEKVLQEIDSKKIQQSEVVIQFIPAEGEIILY